jgi:hypothetical protein
MEHHQRVAGRMQEGVEPLELFERMERLPRHKRIVSLSSVNGLRR